MAAAADAERRRKDWVNERQRAAGGERARRLGWTDVYTFTKAMGERAVEEYATAHDIRTTVLRPSIIESALSYPYPGWIEGYKMAEPIIMAYGRGDLPEFPAAGDSVVDIIPIDLVVNAIIAAAARPPATRGEPRYLHVSS
jgi:nucleoside-diphosphate-sugar epimerase